MRHFTFTVRIRESIWVGLLGLALLSVVACQGGSSPTEPLAAAIVQSTTLSTRLGDLVVITHSCDHSPDLSRIEGELYTTAGVALRQNPALDPYGRRLLDGFELHFRTPEETSKYCGPHGLACFTNEHGVGRLHVWCDGGGVEHETAHAIAYAAGLACWRDVYHGINFRCEVG